VTENRVPPRWELSPSSRLLAAAGGLGLIAGLVVAGWLEPDPQGYGTHRQLGLPPCTIVALTGKRCPTCGMTTAWANVVRGRLPAALGANVGGTLLCLIALVLAPSLLLAAVRGYRPWWLPGVEGAAWLLAAVSAVTLIDWTIRLLVF